MAGAVDSDRPFLFARLAAGCIVGLACAANAQPWVASGPAGATRIDVLDCETGALRARAVLDAPLAAPVQVDFAAGAVFAATSNRRLLRLALPGLEQQALATIEFAVDRLAVASGTDAIVLAGGSGAQPLSAHDPRTLAPLFRYATGGEARVAAIVDLARRKRFVVAFADLAQVWEIAYDRNAPAVLRGLVHDYRMGEAVALPGRLTAREFEVPTPTRAIVAGTSGFELLRIDTRGDAGLINLDVRREIERVVLDRQADGARIAAWQAGARRGWLLGSADASAQRLEVPAWRPARVATDGREIVLAAASGDGQVLAVVRDGAGLSAQRIPAPLGSSLPAASATPDSRARIAPNARAPAEIAIASDRLCAAVLDDRGQWLARFPATR